VLVLRNTIVEAGPHRFFSASAGEILVDELDGAVTLGNYDDVGGVLYKRTPSLHGFMQLFNEDLTGYVLVCHHGLPPSAKSVYSYALLA
jgi:hypothetical protein